MALPQVALVLAGGVTAAAYLDAKYHIRHDLNSGARINGSKAAFEYIAERHAKGKLLIYHLLEEHAQGQNAENLFLMFEDRTWTYRQFFADLHRVGNWLMKELDVQPNEIVALDGGNSPEYMLLWLALEAIGAAPAFINSNLTAAPLAHSVKLCDARCLIAERAIADLVEPCVQELQDAGVRTVFYDEAFIASLADQTPIPDERRKHVRPADISGLIYTSGTTGLPKGTVMLRSRELTTARNVSKFLGLKPGNRMYTVLPLYHGAAHGLCTIPSIYAGSTVVLGRKFSHKTFWPEVRKSNADIVQYVGELCRYLINAPPTPLDRKHNVKVAWGNGMRPDVWPVFQERFGIDTVTELYAQTDGVGASFNSSRGEFQRNAVALRGLYWRWMNSNFEKFVRIDVDTEEILRDKHGFAIECKPDEPGEILHQLDPATADIVFAGYYKNKAAGDKRKIRNVFRKGDMWLRSGDLMRRDRDGRVYFVDRLGDTFRWHSENVSTNEVSDVVGEFDQIAECNVYGVLVPHADGRAGCAAVVPATGVTVDSLDLARMAEHALAALPRYAVPIFIRVVTQLEYTGTMKLQKGRLRSDGVDIAKVSASGPTDRMFWLPPGSRRYEPYGQAEWERLSSGQVRL